jgi:hypothetical protein
MKTRSTSSRVRNLDSILALVALVTVQSLAAGPSFAAGQEDKPASREREVRPKGADRSAEPEAEDIREIRLRKIYQAAGVEGALEDRVHEALRLHWRELDRLRKAFSSKRLDLRGFDAKVRALGKQMDQTIGGLLGPEKFARWCTYRDDDTNSKAGRDAITGQAERLPLGAAGGAEARPPLSWPAARCLSVRRSLNSETLLLSSYEQTYIWAQGYARHCTEAAPDGKGNSRSQLLPLLAKPCCWSSPRARREPVTRGARASAGLRTTRAGPAARERALDRRWRGRSWGWG